MHRSLMGVNRVFVNKNLAVRMDVVGASVDCAREKF